MKIVGTNLILRAEKRDTDDEDLFRRLNLEEWSYYDEPDKPFKNISREEFEKQLEKRRRKPPTTSHRWEINTTEGLHIGWVNYYRLDVQAGHAYVGICLPEKDTWGKGYGTEALGLLIDYLLRKIGLKEVKTAIWTGNKRMVRCAKKCGFKEITRRPHRAKFSVRGDPLERIEFSITRSEWLARGDGGT